MISIIIPAHNAEATIGRCLKSIFSQTISETEIIIVDDGSTDNTYETCLQFTKENKKISLFKTERGGVSRARNFGIKQARGEYVIFVDADDFIDKRFCEILLGLINETNSDMAACGCREIKNIGPRVRHASIKVDKYETYDSYDLMIQGIFSSYRGFLCNKIYKTDIIRKNKLLLNEKISMSEDMLFNVSYIECCKRAVYLPTPLYSYIISSNSSSRAYRTGWFSILQVFKDIIAVTKNKITRHTENLIHLNLILTLYEARIRCRHMNIKFEDIEQKYSINLRKQKRAYALAILKDSKIRLKEKIRFIIFPVAKPLKMRMKR